MAKPKYEKWLLPENLQLVTEWISKGNSESVVSKELIRVSYSTFKEWKKKYPAISAAVNRGKEQPDAGIPPSRMKEVVEALGRSATGFHYKERVYERKFNPKTGEYEMILTKEIEKYSPPNYNSLVFLLLNKDPKNWKRINAAIATDSKEDGVEIINDAPGTNQ